MCIVSIFSKKNGDFILTHNRDESHLRPTSKEVSTQKIHQQIYTSPNDLVSGGTWIFHSEKYVACILNGEYVKHSHQPPYRKSRGLVLLDILKHSDFDTFFIEENFDKIEPFTMIVVDRSSLKKNILVWDGKEKHLENVSDLNLIVRSSSPLYNTSEKSAHQAKFEQLNQPTPTTIFQLHQELKMLPNDRFPTVQTTSITQIIQEQNEIQLQFCPID